MIIHFYNGSKSLDMEEIIRYLEKWFTNIKPNLRGEFITHHLSGLSSERRGEVIKNLAMRFAQGKVRNPTLRERNEGPLLGEVEYERRRLCNPEKNSFGILYDAFSLYEIYLSLIPEEESTHIHLIFTDQLLGTWDEGNRRYHARVGIYSFPSILSVTGVIEAPAKPREFYIKRELGLDFLRLKEEFKGRFIDYDDPRLTEVMKGYTMQALFFHLIGDPFCEDKNCRLYNAHWQEEVIQAQLKKDYEFCKRHKRILTQIKRGVGVENLAVG